MADILQTTFPNAFSFQNIPLKFVPEGSSENKPALVQSNDLVLSRRHAIIWTNDDPVDIYFCISGGLFYITNIVHSIYLNCV